MIGLLVITPVNNITVEKSAYHHLSQSEIGGDNPCSRRSSVVGDKIRRDKHFTAANG